MKQWKPERLVLAVVAALIVFTAGYFAGRATATPDGTAAIIVEHPPVVEETTDTGTADSSKQSDAVEEKINVNTADLETLMTMPGIGETLAQRIIDYRETYGPFTAPEDLTEVSGIGEKRLDAIRDFISVGE